MVFTFFNPQFWKISETLEWVFKRQMHILFQLLLLPLFPWCIFWNLWKVFHVNNTQINYIYPKIGEPASKCRFRVQARTSYQISNNRTYSQESTGGSKRNFEFLTLQKILSISKNNSLQNGKIDLQRSNLQNFQWLEKNDIRNIQVYKKDKKFQ